jgi:hypothetical protein
MSDAQELIFAANARLAMLTRRGMWWSLGIFPLIALMVVLMSYRANHPWMSVLFGFMIANTGYQLGRRERLPSRRWSRQWNRETRRPVSAMLNPR